MALENKLSQFTKAKYLLGWELVRKIDEDLDKFGGYGLRICALIGGTAGSLLPFLQDAHNFSIAGAFVGGVTGALIGHLGGRAIAQYKLKRQNPERADYIKTYVELSEINFNKPDDQQDEWF